MTTALSAHSQALLSRELFRSPCAETWLREAFLDDATYYAQLEQGARYLASRSASDVERREHLGWANRYFRLRLELSAPPPETRQAA